MQLCIPLWGLSEHGKHWIYVLKRSVGLFSQLQSENKYKAIHLTFESTPPLQKKNYPKKIQKQKGHTSQTRTSMWKQTDDEEKHCETSPLLL